MSRAIWFALRFTTLGALLGSARAGAQLCSGGPSFTRPAQLSFGALFNPDVKSVIAGLALGSPAFFGDVHLGASHYPAADAGSFNVGAGVGYRFPRGEQASVQICPLVGITFVNGPNNIHETGNDYSERDVQLGVTAGAVALRAGQVRVVPTASIAYAHASGRLTNSFGMATTLPASFGIVGLGVGVEFSRQVSLMPMVFIPFALRDAQTSAGFTIAIDLTNFHY